jgi:chitooligosaccharide deacetylase
MMITAIVAAVVAVLAHTAPFPFLLDALASDRVMWSAPRSIGDPVIYLTYDDGPNPTATPALLDVLAREGARATFFLIDRHVTEETSPIVRRMFDEGHGVALHSHTRRPVWSSPSTVAEMIEHAAAHIEALAGRRPCRAFRPHAGWRSATLLAGLARVDYQLVGWGWNAWDWNWFRRRTADSVVQRILGRAHDGLIVVIHDGHHVDPRADRSYAVEATAALVPALRERGFRFGTICDVLDTAERPRRLEGRNAVRPGQGRPPIKTSAPPEAGQSRQ